MRLLQILLCFSAAALLHGEAIQSRLNVPEPMVFDLVRPLGAQRGELEINNLAQFHVRRGSTVEWAPEVEFAFADGYSIELEFPIEGAQLFQYKAALQGTFGVFGSERGIHGWQTIGRLDRGSANKSVDALHLAAYRLNSRWSVFNMAGYRYAYAFGQHGRAALLNPTLFYALSRNSSLGVEHNFALGGRDMREHLIMPQVQFTIRRNWIFQAGAGVAGSGRHATSPSVAVRLTRVLN